MFFGSYYWFPFHYFSTNNFLLYSISFGMSEIFCLGSSFKFLTSPGSNDFMKSLYFAILYSNLYTIMINLCNCRKQLHIERIPVTYWQQSTKKCFVMRSKICSSKFTSSLQTWINGCTGPSAAVLYLFMNMNIWLCWAITSCVPTKEIHLTEYLLNWKETSTSGLWKHFTN